MPTLQDLEAAFMAADQAEDTATAQMLADVIAEARKDPVNLVPGHRIAELYKKKPEQDPTFGERAIAVGETGLALATGATTGMIGMVGGGLEGIRQSLNEGNLGRIQGEWNPSEARYESSDRISRMRDAGMEAGTYSPRTQLGQEYTQNVIELLEYATPIAPLAGELGAIGASMRVAQPSFDVASRALPGAVSKILDSPVFRRGSEVEVGGGRGVGAGEVGQANLRRTAAQQLDVPIDLTESQATRNFKLVQEEREIAKNPDIGQPLRDRFAEQNLKLTQNLDEWIDSVGGEAFNIQDIGAAITAPLRKIAAKLKTKIRIAYKDAEKAGEMEVNVKHRGLIDHINSNVPEQSVANVLGFVKDKIISLGAARENQFGELIPLPISLKNSELLRRSIGGATNADPVNIRHSSIMKNAMDLETEGLGGNLYKRARELRTEYGKEFENNILVKSIIGLKKGSSDRMIATEKVLNNAVLSPATPLDSVKHLKKIFIKEGDEGRQGWLEVQGGVLQHIRDEATKNVGRDIQGNPLVSPHKLETVITGLDKVGKLDEVFGLESAAKIRTLNEVAKDILTTPPGSVNFSNTASMLSAAFDMTLSGISGVPAPIASAVLLGLKSIKNAKLKAKVSKALKIENPPVDGSVVSKFGKDVFEARAEVSELQPQPVARPQPLQPAAAAGELAELGDLKGGKKSEVFITSGESIDTQFAILEIDDIITSHTDNFTKTADYPQKLQPRERDRAAYEIQVMEIQNNLRPEWLGESANIQSGAPIIGPDMFVESGNGRTIAIRRAYKRGQADNYKQFLTEKAEQYGLNSSDVAKMENPTLVRIRKSDTDRVKLVEAANEDIVSSFSASEVAAKDAKKLPDLSNFNISESGSLTSAANRPFIREFFSKVITPNQMISMVDENGMITQQGLIRLKNAIYNKAYGSEGKNIARMAESTDSNIKNITNGMVKAAPDFGAMVEKIAKGDLHNLNIAKELVTATENLSKLRERGTTFAENAKQGSMLADPVNPLVEALTQILETYGRSNEKVSQFILEYVKKVEAAGNPKQGTLFGDIPPPTKADVLKAVINTMEKSE